MNKIRVIALIAALIAGLTLYKVLGIISQPPKIPTTPVVVAAVDIPENTELTEEMLTMAEVPTVSVLPNAVLDREEAVGMVLASEVLVGEQIVSRRLVPLGERDASSSSLAYVIEPGMRAITVNVGNDSGLANMIRPGNRVDVVLCYEPLPDENAADKAGGEKIIGARILVQDVEVLAVDANMSRRDADISDEKGEVSYGSVTLIVTPEQAVTLSFGDAAGSLRLILRSQLDDKLVDVPAVTSDEMLR